MMETVQQEISSKKAKIKDLESKVQAASEAGDRQLLLQLLLEQEKQLTALEQEKLLLMQQQAGAAIPAVYSGTNHDSSISSNGVHRFNLGQRGLQLQCCSHMCYSVHCSTIASLTFSWCQCTLCALHTLL